MAREGHAEPGTYYSGRYLPTFAFLSEASFIDSIWPRKC
jgi:hypothetical protein